MISTGKKIFLNQFYWILWLFFVCLVFIIIIIIIIHLFIIIIVVVADVVFCCYGSIYIYIIILNMNYLLPLINI